MSARTRVLAVALVCVLAVGGSVAYLMAARTARDQAIGAAPAVASTTMSELTGRPHIVFRHTALGADYGAVAMVALDDAGGARAITSAWCDRVDVAAERMLCLAADRGVLTTYQALLLDEDLNVVRELPLAGLPSRARLSADGSLAATTSFVAGDSYAADGFSTRTVISRLDGADGPTADLETFTLNHDGRAISPVDRNYWGVTFAADDDTFYATASWSGETWLVRGSITGRSMTTLRSDAECPSLSPDGTKVAYKKRDGGPPGTWRLAVLDLATGTESWLAETRSVDDQVAWLDDATVVYGLARPGADAATSDVIMVPADGSGTPEVLIEHAWSPSIVR